VAGCPTCGPNPAFGLGQAGSFAVLALANGSIDIGTAATTITGDVGVGPLESGTLEKATIDGHLFVDPTATVSIHPDLIVTCGTSTKNLSGADADARAASLADAALPPTQVFGNITSTTTITGNGGLNVIDVGTIDLMDTLTLAGTASDVFIINVSGDFTCNGCAISLSGGVTYTNVLFNVFNAGTTLVDIFKPVAIVNGIFLAPLRAVAVDKATLNGAVIGAGVAMDTLTVHSGATVTFCPPCPACSP